MGETIYKGDILVVDDKPANLELLLAILREQHYRARIATSGAMAISAVRLAPPDLVLLDITMPEMDGYEVCSRLKADLLTAPIPVIFISALDEAIDKVKAFKVGGVDYITKPFQLEEVIARIENQLRISRLQQDLKRKNQELAKKNEELLRSQQKADKIFLALSEALSGVVIGNKYRLEKKIGMGGFGIVYKATHVDLHHSLAVKVFQPKSDEGADEALERFRLEGISACRINHPNALSVLDFGVTEDGLPYLVMELLEGHTLGKELKEKVVLLPARVAQIIAPVCEVLAAAHQAGVIHRDIKPENIFLHKVGDTEIVKLVDFGIAKLVGDIEGIQDITLDGRIIGTPSYMSPERLNNQSYDGKADVYSVGVMLYQMLSGRLPFQSSEKKSEPLTIAMMHLTKPPKPLRELNPKLSEEIEAIVMKALAKSPADRPTAKELGEEFVKAVGSLPQTSSESGFASDTDEQGVRTDTQTLVRPFYFDEEF